MSTFQSDFEGRLSISSEKCLCQHLIFEQTGEFDSLTDYTAQFTSGYIIFTGSDFVVKLL